MKDRFAGSLETGSELSADMLRGRPCVWAFCPIDEAPSGLTASFCNGIIQECSEQYAIIS